MTTNRKHAVFTTVRTAMAATLLLIAATGCNTTAPTEPSGGGTTTDTPVLPAPEKLHFDFRFFDGADKSAERSKKNFFNAAIRVAVIETAAKLILTPPVAAFAVALHTIPSPQDDGSYIWIYTWVDGDEEAQIRLRGKERGSKTEWEMRVTALSENPPIDNLVWFEGETWNDGENGTWYFHDVESEENGRVARLDWSNGSDTEELTFTDLDENPGDMLGYRRDGDVGSIEYTDASEGGVSFIRFDESDGTGSLKVPDYNDGEEACWDENQNDVECSPAS